MCSRFIKYNKKLQKSDLKWKVDFFYNGRTLKNDRKAMMFKNNTPELSVHQVFIGCSLIKGQDGVQEEKSCLRHPK